MKLFTKESKREYCNHCGCGKTVSAASTSMGLVVMTCTACQRTTLPFPSLEEAQKAWIRDHLRDLGKMLEKTEDEFSKKITEMQDIVGDARENLNKITGMTYED